jgi:hypothetical protein
MTAQVPYTDKHFWNYSIPSYAVEDIREYLAVTHDPWIPFLQWLRRHEENANLAPNSFFGSNGTVPMAKEKDTLGKLFEKYRGERCQAEFCFHTDGVLRS